MTGVFDEFLNATSASRRAWDAYTIAQSTNASQQRDSYSVTYGDWTVHPNRDRLAANYGSWTVHPDCDYLNANRHGMIYSNVIEWIRDSIRIPLDGLENGAEKSFDTEGVRKFLEEIEVVKD